MNGQLELFKESLPIKPYATDDLARGLKIHHQKNALQKRYLQHNPPAKIHWLVFDCDHAGAFEVAGQMSTCPAPNFEVVNPKNGHSHLFYGLVAPVLRNDLARAAPLRYLASIEYALREVLRGDFGYAGLISKNPTHPSWHFVDHQKCLWDLGDLAEFLNLPKKLPKRALSAGLGRNCSLFEAARHWAYRSVLAYRLTGSTQEKFSKAVYDECVALNNFPVPLPLAEVKSTAKSVARWTWQKYTGRASDQEFSKIQAARASKGKGIPRYRHTPEERLQIVLEACTPGANVSEIAKAHGLGKTTLYRWLQEK